MATIQEISEGPDIGAILEMLMDPGFRKVRKDMDEMKLYNYGDKSEIISTFDEFTGPRNLEIIHVDSSGIRGTTKTTPQICFKAYPKTLELYIYGYTIKGKLKKIMDAFKEMGYQLHTNKFAFYAKRADLRISVDQGIDVIREDFVRIKLKGNESCIYDSKTTKTLRLIQEKLAKIEYYWT